MSKTAPMDRDHREAVYLLQTGRNYLTPAQARRVRHKGNEAMREVPVRIGRLRRRFDKKDQAQVKSTSLWMTGFLRSRIQGSRYDPKPNSKRQQKLRRTQIR